MPDCHSSSSAGEAVRRRPSLDKSYSFDNDPREPPDRFVIILAVTLWKRGKPPFPMHRSTKGALAIALSVVSFGFTYHHSGESFQPSTLVVLVVDSLARYPLANADVIDLATGQHRFTDERGQAYLPWPYNGQLQIRVREVGYEPRQRTLQRSESASTTFEMTKVAYVLSTVRATSRCSTTEDPASRDLSLAVLDQLRQGAEKYNEFRRLYPFDLTVERRIAAVPPEGEEPKIFANTEKYRSDKFEARYKPGDIIEYSRGTFHVPILFLSTFADSVFWDNHCFVASGSQTYGGNPVVRLDFSPRAGIIEPEYEGSAYLDSATSYLRRIDFHLAISAIAEGRRGSKDTSTFIAVAIRRAGRRSRSGGSGTSRTGTGASPITCSAFISRSSNTARTNRPITRAANSNYLSSPCVIT